MLDIDDLIDYALTDELTDAYVARAEKVYGSVEAYHKTAAQYLVPDQLDRYRKAQLVLQPKQLEFAQLARAADDYDNPYEIGIGGARGPGKSFVVLAQAAVDDCQRFPGLPVLYLRKTGKAAVEQLQQLYLDVLHHVKCDALAQSIRFSNGSTIVIGGFKDDAEALKYQGLQYSLIIIEEATQLSGSTINRLLLSLRSSNGYRPRAYFSFNPLGIGHSYFKKRFVDPYRNKQPSDTIFIPATVDDNIFVDPEYKGRLERQTGAELRAYRHGDWDVTAGAYFETWHRPAHVINPLTPDMLKGWRVWASMDAGFSHWNATYLLAQDGDGNKYLVDELAHRKLHPPQIAPDIINLFKRYGLNPGNIIITVGTDAFKLTAGQSVTLADQYQQHGLKMSPADMSPGSRIAGWQHIAQLLGDPRNGTPPRFFVSEHCGRFIEALPGLQRNPNNPEDALKVDTDENGDGGDDFPDGARYGLYNPNEVRVLFESG